MVMGYRILGPIADIDARSPDAASVLDGDETSLAWVEIEIPIVALPAPGSAARCCESAEEHTDRLASIARWAETHGGIAAALTDSPPLLRLGRPGDIVILDGYHRIALARELGLAAVRACLTEEPLED